MVRGFGASPVAGASAHLAFPPTLSPSPPPASPTPPTRPSATLVVVDAPSITDEYQEVCRQLGIVSVAMLEARFEAFLAEQAWPLFPVHKVEDYLQKICLPGLLVHWKPLTDEDAKWIPTPFSMAVRPATYQRLIPLRVLKRIQTIRAHFSAAEAKIIISDFDVPRPDPFAMVVVGTKRWVFDVWDEPGF